MIQVTQADSNDSEATIEFDDSGVAKEEMSQQQSASTEETQKDETAEDSETSEDAEGESEESEELDAKDEDGGGESQEKPKKKSGFQRRIEKLNRSISARDSEIMSLRAELEKSRSTGTKEKSGEEIEALATSQMPSESDFESYADYEAAMIEWRIDQRLAKRDADANALKERLAAEAKAKDDADSFEAKRQDNIKKSAEFEKTHPDFKDVVMDVDDIILSPSLQMAILDNGPEFVYELAKNREELERINALDHSAAQRAIGRIEERLAAKTAKPKEEKKVQSKAAPPISTTRASTVTGSHKNIYDEGLSFKEYEKLRAEGSR